MFQENPFIDRYENKHLCSDILTKGCICNKWIILSARIEPRLSLLLIWATWKSHISLSEVIKL